LGELLAQRTGRTCPQKQGPTWLGKTRPLGGHNFRINLKSLFLAGWDWKTTQKSARNVVVYYCRLEAKKKGGIGNLSSFLHGHVF
jgi:hypothetical protein